VTQDRYKRRPIRIDGDLAYVTLTKGYVAVIDAADAERDEVRNWSWSAQVCYLATGEVRTVYAHRKDHSPGANGRKVYLHRVLVEATEGVLVDHKDGDALNCRRENLRFATRAENARNSRVRSHNASGVKGVRWDKRKGRFYASIIRDGRSIRLGGFSTAEEAGAAYAAASERLHGEFGRAA
jgi:hypothetical protein